MKTELSKEQSKHLIDLGVGSDKASKCWVTDPNDDESKQLVNHDEYCYECAALKPQPVFTLTDMLSIIPKWIKYRNMLLWLQIRVDEYQELWCCEYEGGPYGCDNADTFQSAEELIDALYELLVYCINEKLITIK